MFQEVARQVGIKVNVQTLEWSIFLDKTKNHDFDMYVGAWISTPIPTDHKQIFHTESYNGGSNYVGFGNDYTDSLINQIRVTLDVEKRKQLQWKFQEILHEQVPYIFLYYPKERLAIHKRFDNAEPSVMRPGYREAAFKLKQLQ
jgi:peptide/nickel transport system substrate-binding protein